jgi:hypothetical protein
LGGVGFGGESIISDTRSHHQFTNATTPLQVNGKKLTPNSVVVLKFMVRKLFFSVKAELFATQHTHTHAHNTHTHQVPLLIWASAVIVIFGVTFQKLAGLQAPLSSLNAAARVTYGISRVRLAVGRLGFGWGRLGSVGVGRGRSGSVGVGWGRLGSGKMVDASNLL